MSPHDLSYLLKHLEQSLFATLQNDQSVFLRQTFTSNAYKADLNMYKDVIKIIGTKPLKTDNASNWAATLGGHTSP